MSRPAPALDFPALYSRFHLPLAGLDCGERCAPYNEGGAPFCCDITQAVPAAYDAEWAYLQANTDLWRPYVGRTPAETALIRAQTPDGQTPIACLGHRLCQRNFRAVACRAFPFFPYLTLQGEFIGLSYYWEHEDHCWVISHLGVVTSAYRAAFVVAYEEIFAAMPEERELFRQYSISMRRVFGRRKRLIPLLHRNGFYYKVRTRDGSLRRVRPERLPMHGPYRLAARLPFPDEAGSAHP